MTQPGSASTQRITLALKGMFSANCAGEIERALVQLDGVVAAQVNYATERATVVYDAAQVTALKMVNAVRSIGYDTPVERLVLPAEELLYASSGRTVERMLAKAKGIVHVRADLQAGIIDLAVLSGFARDTEWMHLFRGCRFSEDAKFHTHARSVFYLRTILLVVIEILILWSAGAHAGLFDSFGSLHLPVVVAIFGLLAQFGVGYPFYQFAYDAALGGEFDVSVVVALLSSGLTLLSLPLGILSPSPWLTDVGIIAATSLTTGWFLMRAFALWMLPSVHENRKPHPMSASQSHARVVPSGSRR